MASKSFIDLAGLQHYDGKLQEVIAGSYVNLAGAQTISGAKTFTASPAVSMGQPVAVLSNPNLTKGTNPSSVAYGNIIFQDKTASASMVKRGGSLDFSVDTNGQTGAAIRAFNWGVEDNTNGALAIYYPKNGTPYTAAPTPAASDNSTKIATTAFVKAQNYLTSHQSLSNYVTLDGTQTITGAKTFSSDITLSSRQLNNASCIEFKPTSASANNGGYLDFHFNQSNADYTSRIIESASGTLSINNVTITTGKVVTAATFSGALSGNASTATKLQTARSIDSGSLEFQGSANFDGSGNISLNVTHHRSIASNGNTNNYPFHRIAYIPALSGNYLDRGITLLVSRDYSGGGWGICRVILRTNNAGAGGTASLNVQWLVRSSELPADSIQAGFCNEANASYVDVFYKSHAAYNSAICRVLAHSNSRGSVGRGFTLIASSNEASNTTASDPLTSVECYATIAAAGTTLHSQAYTSTIVASDVGVVGTASNVTGVVAVANGGTGSATQNFVDLATDQSIGGVKTFTSSPVLNQSSLNMTVKDTNSTTTRTDTVLQAVSSNSSYGINAMFGTNGAAVVGAGEGKNSQLTELAGASNENVYVVADGAIYFKPNANTYANAKTFVFTANGNIEVHDPAYERGVSTTAITRELFDLKDKNGVRYSLLEAGVAADKSSYMGMYAYKTTAASGNNIGSIRIGCDSSGNVFTQAPTPAAADNSTKIATTAWARTATGNFACNAATATSATTATTANSIGTNGNPSTATKMYYTVGQPAIGTAAGNAYKGSSSDPTLLSFPENGTVSTTTNANVQNLRMMWASSTAYFTDIFVSPNNHYIWHRNVVNGNAYGWRRLVEENVTGIGSFAWNISISGNAGTATKATQDASGNVITTTYATKAELEDIPSVTNAQIDTLFA